MIIQNWKWNCPFSTVSIFFWSYMVKHYYVQRWSNSKYLVMQSGARVWAMGGHGSMSLSLSLSIGISESLAKG